MVINTTNGPRRTDTPRGTREPIDAGTAAEAHTINTSAVVEEDLEYIDEDEETEILSVLPATGWYATFEDGRQEPLVAFVAMDSAKMYGVTVDTDGRVDLESS